MLVRNIMSPNPITAHDDMTVPEALRLIKEKKIHFIPIVNKQGELQGVVSDRDLHRAEPSEATTLSIWEISDLLSKITVAEVMQKDKVVIAEDAPIEEAAKLLTDSMASGIPVIRGKQVVGIITKTDLLNTFLNMLGGRRSGVRTTIICTNKKGVIFNFTKKIFEAGGDIVGLSVIELDTHHKYDYQITLKVQDITIDNFKNALNGLDLEVTDIREV